MPLRIGIDEAGYGPNLGPLVMTAVAADVPDAHPFDLWADLTGTVTRAGGDPATLWIDDSKAVHKSRRGLDRLEAATLSALDAIGKPRPETLGELLAIAGAGSLADVELDRWIAADSTWSVPRTPAADLVHSNLAARPFAGATWTLAAVRVVVVGPRRFNDALDRGGSKTVPHADAFADLLRWAWDATPEGAATRIRSDKHGGRNHYSSPLADALPDAWVTALAEGPTLSRYALRGHGRTIELSLSPRADAEDGLVALASMISKGIRERWMEVFNAFWAARVPGLKPTAGYPVDAARFRWEIEGLAREVGLDPRDWWRAR